MRKTTILLLCLAIAVMLLAGCAPEEGTSTAFSGADFPAGTETSGAETLPATGTAALIKQGVTDAGIPVTGEEDPSRLSNQLDYEVWSQEGDPTGEVNDMVVDLDTSAVSYVIIGTGGFLEVGEKDVLVPWDLVQLETKEDTINGGEKYAFGLRIDQETFTHAPDTDVVAILPSAGAAANGWDIDIRKYWEIGVIPGTPYPDGTAIPDKTATVTTDDSDGSGDTAPAPVALQGVVLASVLLDSNIRVGTGSQTVNDGQVIITGTAEATETDDRNQVEDIPVDDLIVDVDTGRIRYIVLKASFEDKDHWIPVPLDRLQWDAHNGTYTLGIDYSTLQKAPAFEDGQYPVTTIEGWDSDYLNYWQQ